MALQKSKYYYYYVLLCPILMKENKFGHEIHSATAPDAGVRIGSKTRKTPIPHAIQFQLCRHHPDIKKLTKSKAMVETYSLT